jgi:hypothetical protein
MRSTAERMSFFASNEFSLGIDNNLVLNTWVKWLRMQGHRLPATLEVTGSNPGQGKINLIKN